LTALNSLLGNGGGSAAPVDFKVQARLEKVSLRGIGKNMIPPQELLEFLKKETDKAPFTCHYVDLPKLAAPVWDINSHAAKKARQERSHASALEGVCPMAQQAGIAAAALALANNPA
jgi:hypothetical protein